MGRPAEQHLSVERVPADGICPECGATDLARYPVVGERGWTMVVKCQACLFAVDRRPWNRLGPYTLLVDTLG